MQGKMGQHDNSQKQIHSAEKGRQMSGRKTE